MSITVGLGAFSLQTKEAPETLTATTANMERSGEPLKLDVLSWSSDADRKAAVEAIMDALPLRRRASRTRRTMPKVVPLGDLPTVGYVWSDSSSVGYVLK